MKFKLYTEVSIIRTPGETTQGVAGAVGVILGGSSGALGQQYAVQLRDEAGGWGEVWMVDEADLTPTGRTFSREEVRGDSSFAIGVRPQRYIDDNRPRDCLLMTDEPPQVSDESLHLCEGLVRAVADPDIPMAYNDMFRESGIFVQDGGSSVMVIEFCPFCGVKLPDSLRDEWFDRLDQLGLEPDSPELPLDMRSGAWWRRTRADT
jgi:hypothetical protein